MGTRRFRLPVSFLFPPVPFLFFVDTKNYALTLTAEATELTAGQKTVLTAAFANPETVNQKAKNKGIVWSVADEKGESTKLVSVSSSGQLTTQKTLTETTVFVITAASDGTTYLVKTEHPQESEAEEDMT